VPAVAQEGQELMLDLGVVGRLLQDRLERLARDGRVRGASVLCGLEPELARLVAADELRGFQLELGRRGRVVSAEEDAASSSRAHAAKAGSEAAMAGTRMRSAASSRPSRSAPSTPSRMSSGDALPSWACRTMARTRRADRP